MKDIVVTQQNTESKPKIDECNYLSKCTNIKSKTKRHFKDSDKESQKIVKHFANENKTKPQYTLKSKIQNMFDQIMYKYNYININNFCINKQM